jgi:hypothetical protein
MIRQHANEYVVVLALYQAREWVRVGFKGFWQRDAPDWLLRQPSLPVVSVYALAGTTDPQKGRG